MRRRGPSDRGRRVRPASRAGFINSLPCFGLRRAGLDRIRRVRPIRRSSRPPGPRWTRGRRQACGGSVEERTVGENAPDDADSRSGRRGGGAGPRGALAGAGPSGGGTASAGAGSPGRSAGRGDVSRGDANRAACVPGRGPSPWGRSRARSRRIDIDRDRDRDRNRNRPRPRPRPRPDRDRNRPRSGSIIDRVSDDEIERIASGASERS